VPEKNGVPRGGNVRGTPFFRLADIKRLQTMRSVREKRSAFLQMLRQTKAPHAPDVAVSPGGAGLGA